MAVTDRGRDNALVLASSLFLHVWAPASPRCISPEEPSLPLLLLAQFDAASDPWTRRNLSGYLIHLPLQVLPGLAARPTAAGAEAHGLPPPPLRLAARLGLD